MTLFVPTHLEKWTLPRNYGGAHWPDWYVFLGRNRDSSILENSNFDQGLAAVRDVMSKESVPNDPEESATVQVVSENHWACGWVEWIAIHESDTEALTMADGILQRLENYPVLDESELSHREFEAYLASWYDYGAKEFIKNLALSDRAKDLIMDHQSELLGVYQECLPSGEFYVPEGDGVRLLTDHSSDRVTRDQLAQLLRELRKL